MSYSCDAGSTSVLMTGSHTRWRPGTRQFTVDYSLLWFTPFHLKFPWRTNKKNALQILISFLVASLWLLGSWQRYNFVCGDSLWDVPKWIQVRSLQLFHGGECISISVVRRRRDWTEPCRVPTQCSVQSLAVLRHGDGNNGFHWCKRIPGQRCSQRHGLRTPRSDTSSRRHLVYCECHGVGRGGASVTYRTPKDINVEQHQSLQAKVFNKPLWNILITVA